MNLSGVQPETFADKVYELFGIVLVACIRNQHEITPKPVAIDERSTYESYA